MDFNRLVLVNIQCPYDGFGRLQVQKMFGKLLDLKLKGYLQEYAYGVMPFDSTDYIAAHHLICELNYSDGELSPIMGWKSITLQRCQIHQVAFPPIAALRTIPVSQHLGVIDQILERFSDSPHKLSYSGGLTILPELRTNREVTSQLWDMCKAAWISYELENDIIESIGFSALQFKVIRHYSNLGYRFLEDENGDLGELSFPTLMNGYKVKLIHRNHFAQEGLDLVNKYRFWLKDKIELSPSQIDLTQNKRNISSI